VWSLINDTPYLAERAFCRDRDGAEVWLVVVKATFAITAGGETILADEQVPIVKAPEYWGKAGQSSLRYDSDLVPTKEATDVLLHGRACAPPGRRVTEVDVDLRIGPVAKRLRVFGRRFWTAVGPDLLLSRPAELESLPLMYEVAFGGIDVKAAPGERRGEVRNPIGVGFAAAPETLKDTVAIAVEYPDSLVKSPEDRPPPAGFGPIPREWSPRTELAGTYDEAWEESRRPLVPLDFQDRFYQCAPEDQQVRPYLRGGEPVQVTNTTAQGQLSFTLPRVSLGFETKIGGGVVHHHATLHTVVIESDVPRAILVWQTALPCHGKLDTLLATRVYEKRLLAFG
jgi:hypothetical protein